MDNFDNAEKDLLETVRLNPSYNIGTASMSTPLLEPGKKVRAIQQFAAAPASAENSYRRAVNYEDLGVLEKALADLDAALQSNASYVDALVARGRIRNTLGRTQPAFDDLSRAIQLDSKRGDAYGTRGRIYYGAKEYEQAVQDFDTALQLNPKDTSTLLSRANACLELGKTDEAQQGYAQCIQLNPNDSVAYYNRGLTYYNKRQYVTERSNIFF